MSLPETEQEILDYLDGLTRNLDPSSLSRFTTAQIAGALSISRSHASEYLNDLVRSGLVVKAGSRPLHYFHRRSLERFLQAHLSTSSYASAEKLLALRVGAAQQDFEKMVGHDQSLGACVEQCVAALEYPIGGLPVLVVGERGTGKTLLAQLSREYGVNHAILRPDSGFEVVECSAFAEDPRGFQELLFGSGQSLGRSVDSGIIVLRDVDCLPASALELLLSLTSPDAAASASGKEETLLSSARFFLLTSQSAASSFVRSLSSRVPLVACVPALRDRSQRERESLALRFLRVEGQRMGVDVHIARSAFHCLVAADFADNVRGLRSCVTNCCASAYSRRKGDSLEIFTYQLPSSVLAEGVAGEAAGADNDCMIDVSQDSEDADGRRMVELFSACVELGRRAAAQQITAETLAEGVRSYMRDFEDYLVFGNVAANATSEAYESVIAGIVGRVNEAYGIDLTRKTALLVSREIYLQLWPETQFSQWELANTAAISDLFSQLSARWRFSRMVLDRICGDVMRALGVSLSTLMRIPLLIEVCAYEAAASERTSAGIIVSHGYATASSIADAANRMLHTHIFEAIDMTYDQQIIDIVGSLQNTLERLSHCREVALLVDMGSLEGIHDALAGLPGMTLGVMNNASTGLALEVGSGLMAGEGLRGVLASAAHTCQTRYELFEDTGVDDAVLFCSDGGVDAAEKIKALVLQSLSHEIGLRLVPVGLQQLRRNGSRDQVFSHYRVRAIIGTTNPQVDGVLYIALEDVIANDHAKIDQVFSSYLSSDELAAFHENLLKNFTLRNVVDAITILNPARLFSEIEEAVRRLGQLTGEEADGRIAAGLYVHLCCLVERLVTRSPIQSYPNEQAFEMAHESFIRAFRESFSAIVEHYKVAIPTAEIAYAWDYLHPHHKLQGQKDFGNGEDTYDF